MFSFLRLSSRPALPLRSAMPKAHSAQHSHRSASEAEAADITARILLETNSVLFRPEDPFTFTSGRKSPVYIDCRRLIPFPRARTTLMGLGAELIERHAGYEGLDAIPGGETAAIPFAAWIADRLSLPMLYVRKQPKGFGRNAQIEGELRDEARVLLVEDLASEGTSKLNFVRAIRQAGGHIDHALSSSITASSRRSRRTSPPRGSPSWRSAPGGMWRRPPSGSGISNRGSTRR